MTTFVTTLATALIPAPAPTTGGQPAGAGGLFSAGNILQGGASVFSALASIGQGIAERNANDLEIEALKVEAANERLIGATEAARLQRDLADTVEQQLVGFAASGVDVGVGSPVQARREAIDDAELSLDISRNNTRLRTLALRRRQRQLGARSALASATSFLRAGSTLFETGADIARRG